MAAKEGGRDPNEDMAKDKHHPPITWHGKYGLEKKNSDGSPA